MLKYVALIFSIGISIILGGKLIVIKYKKIIEHENLKFGITRDQNATLIGVVENTYYEKIIIPNRVNDFSVTSISDDCFKSNKEIKYVFIPNSIAYLGKACFFRAFNLETVIFEKDSKITSIEPSTFSFNESGGNLKTIIIPKSVKKIGDYAFAHSKNLTEVIFEEGSELEIIGTCAFLDNVNLSQFVIPEKVKIIGSQAFLNASKIETLYIPKNVEKIEDAAFDGTINLKEVLFEDNIKLKFIGDYAFRHTRSLKSITIPKSVKYMGAYMLAGAYRLETITIPFIGQRKDVSTGPQAQFGVIFGQRYFDYSYPVYYFEEQKENSNHFLSSKDYYLPMSLKSIVITNGKKIPPYAFAFMPTKNYYEKSYIESITLPKETISIGLNAFFNLNNLVTMTIPKKVEVIDKSAFYGVTNLSRITFEKNSRLRKIGNLCFAGASKLTNVIIPISVDSIDFSAFYGCNNITIYCEAKTKPLNWHESWNDKPPLNFSFGSWKDYNRPVYWGDEWKYDQFKEPTILKNQ
mgnify:CR=1 FL=1